MVSFVQNLTTSQRHAVCTLHPALNGGKDNMSSCDLRTMQILDHLPLTFITFSYTKSRKTSMEPRALFTYTSLNDMAASAEVFVGVCSLAPIGMSEKEGALEASQRQCFGWTAPSPPRQGSCSDQ